MPPLCRCHPRNGCKGARLQWAGWVEPSPVSARCQCGKQGKQPRCTSSLPTEPPFHEPWRENLDRRCGSGGAYHHSAYSLGISRLRYSKGDLNVWPSGPSSGWSDLVASDQPGSYSGLAQAIPLSDGVVRPALTRGEANQGTSILSPSRCFCWPRLPLCLCEPTVIPPQRLGSCPDQPILTTCP